MRQCVAGAQLKLLAAPHHFVQDRHQVSPYSGFTHLPTGRLRPPLEITSPRSELHLCKSRISHGSAPSGLLARFLLMPVAGREGPAALSLTSTLPPPPSTWAPVRVTHNYRIWCRSLSPAIYLCFFPLSSGSACKACVAVHIRYTLGTHQVHKCKARVALNTR